MNYKATILPEGELRIDWGFETHNFTPTQVRVLVALCREGSLDRLIESADDNRRADIFRATRHLYECGLLHARSTFMTFTTPQLAEGLADLIRWLSTEWNGWNYYQQHLS